MNDVLDILDIIAEHLDDEYTYDDAPKVTVVNCRVICTNKIHFAAPEVA